MTLKHEPETPCRPSIYGEGIYLAAWQRFLATKPEHAIGYDDERFGEIFEPRIPIDLVSNDRLQKIDAQRAATVAASFIAWLGTNCGNAFIDAAQKRYGENRDRAPEAFLFEWARTNRRLAGVNGFRRTAEAIVKKVNAFDLEVLEVTAEWLGTADGFRLVADAEKEIALTRAAINERDSMELRAQNRARELREKGIVA